MQKLFKIAVTFILLLWVFEDYVTANPCQVSHEGCMRGCDPIENTYYQTQCQAACGSGLVCCLNQS